MTEDSTQNNGLLTINGLKTFFFTRWGIVKAVDGLDLSVRKGETLGLVGESGCGKSITALSILRLVPRPKGRIVEGEIVFQGRDLLRWRRKRCAPSGVGRSG